MQPVKVASLSFKGSHNSVGSEKRGKNLANQSSINEMVSKASLKEVVNRSLHPFGSRKRDSMPSGSLMGLGSDQKSANHSMQHSTSVRSVRLADPEIDEDTYQVFVNRNDDAQSTQKAL